MGNTGTFRSKFSGIYGGDYPVFADASHIYAQEETGSNEFYRYSIDTTGLTQIDGTTLNGLGGCGGAFQVAAGLVYGAGGGIVNASTTPPSQVATLNLIDFYGSGSSPEDDGFVADPSLGKQFVMLENVAGTSAYGLTRYDLATYLPEVVLSLPSVLNPAANAWNPLRWGQDGLLAMLASQQNYTTDQTTTYRLPGVGGSSGRYSLDYRPA